MSETVDVPATTKGNNKSYVANPRAPKGDEIDESTGAVASDSLASESIRAGGGFSQNSKAGILGVKGANSTLNNEDTSAARRLDPAEDREDRDGSRFASTNYPDQKVQFDGTHTSEGYTGGTGRASTLDSSDPGYGAYDTQRSAADLGAAPTYADNVAGTLRSEGELKPKGRNLVEDDSLPAHRSTFTGDVGGPNDPGRLAEQKFQLTNAAEGSDAGYARDTGRTNDGNEYDALNPRESA